MSSTRMPRTSANSTRPLKVAISGCSISGVALVTPGVALASRGDLAPVAQLPAIALHHGMAVQPDDLVEQLGAEAVHHAHHDDQRGDAEHHRDEAEPRDDGDERLALARQQIAAGDHAFVARQEHAVGEP